MGADKHASVWHVLLFLPLPFTYPSPLSLSFSLLVIKDTRIMKKMVVCKH